MNLKQARYIKAIAEEGGITAAARTLYISQPSLSQMLRQVEEELGVMLFDRSSSPFRPTYAGERYLHAATVMLNTNEILNNEIQEIRQEGSGKLRLGISMQRASQLLPWVLPQFTKAYPHVALELHEMGSTILEQMVQEGHVDVALAATDASRPELTYQLMERERIGILAGWHSSLTRQLPSGTPIRLEQVGEGNFVALKVGHSIRMTQDLLFREHGVHAPIFLESDSLETAHQITLQCDCYMLCSDSYVGPEEPFYPLEDYENHRHFYACLRSQPRIPRYMDSFLQMVRESLEKFRGQNRVDQKLSKK